MRPKRNMKRALLKYNGGKWRLAPWIISNFPEHKTYVELFGGGGSVLLEKARSKHEVYNDLDGQLVNFMKILREQPRDLIRAIRFTPYAEEEFPVSMEPSIDPVEAARRYYIHCWMNRSNNKEGGTYRPVGSVKSGGGYNPPRLLADVRPLYKAAMRMRGVSILSRPYQEVLPVVDHANTLIYADPPYLQKTRRGKYYTQELLTEEQHQELLEALLSCKSMVVLSGYASELYDGLLKDWERVTMTTRSDALTEKEEVLWIKKR